MKVTIVNNSNAIVSTGLGSVLPMSSLVASVNTAHDADIITDLRKLAANGSITLTEASDSVDIVPQTNVTTKDLTYYVDGTTGSNSADGSATMPFKTINKVVNLLPSTITSTITINVAAGVYAETIDRPFLFSAAGSLIIQGATVAFTPTTGLASGVTATISGNVITVTGAGWTTHDLKGKFVVLSGSSAGSPYPIYDNDATTLTVGGYGSAIASAGGTFSFIDLTVTLTNAPGRTTTINTTTASSTNKTITFKTMKLSSSSTYVISNTAGAISIISCYIQSGANTFYATLGVRAGAYTMLTTCYVNCTAAGFAIYSMKGSSFYLYNTVVVGGSGLAVDGGGLAIIYYSTISGCTDGIAIWNNCYASIWASNFLNCTNNGIIFKEGGAYAYIGNNVSINTCGAWGVANDNSVAALSNRVVCYADFSIVGAVAGEITLNGVADTTLASVRAASPKIITNATTLNMVASF